MRNGIPNLGALQAFEATARLGSFSRAGEELALTHSAIYRQVTGLEQRLGVQLFTRARRRVTLTDAGAEYAGRVRHHPQPAVGQAPALRRVWRLRHARLDRLRGEPLGPRRARRRRDRPGRRGAAVTRTRAHRRLDRHRRRRRRRAGRGLGAGRAAPVRQPSIPSCARPATISAGWVAHSRVARSAS